MLHYVASTSGPRQLKSGLFSIFKSIYIFLFCLLIKSDKSNKPVLIEKAGNSFLTLNH
jgi:hypothetical protein